MNYIFFLKYKLGVGEMTQSVKYLLQKQMDPSSATGNYVKRWAWLNVLVIPVQGRLK